MFNQHLIQWVNFPLLLGRRGLTFGAQDNGDYEIGLFCRLSFMEVDKSKLQGAGFRYWRNQDLDVLVNQVTDWIIENNKSNQMST